ncbi:MAG TPA: response regulator [Blastocatellia bacterium]|nr:response regulator [Blastocatellia bacterium]
MGQKVLLADDSITVQKIVKLSLTEEGIEVIAVGNGEQAVQQLETLQPDLVMADVFMPGKDGYEVCEFVKSQAHLRHIPVILLVHAFEPFDPERAKKVRADHQLTKPFQSIRTLVTTVQNLLQALPVAAETPAVMPEPAQAMPTQSSAPVATTYNKTPDEEFAEVSSLPPSNGANWAVEEAAASVPGFASISLPVSLTPPLPMSGAEANLPVPPTSDTMLSNTDFMPPAELPLLPSTEWQTELPPDQPGWDMSVSTAVRSEPMTVASAPVSLVTTPAFAENSTEDVLDLADVLMPDSEGIAVAQEATTHQLNTDIPLLTVLGNLPANTETEEPQANLPAPISSSLAGNFDLGKGQLEPQVESPLIPEESIAQDVKMGSLVQSGGVASAQISEEMIEEIVNRVVQRLSTKAIQEVAWEVVPEMAELLLRKHISQQQQLTH